jgi:hypothetical protein
MNAILRTNREGFGTALVHSPFRAWSRPIRTAFAAAIGVVLFGGTVAWHEPPAGSADVGERKNQPNRTIRLDGRYVHNVGRLQLQITNIGETGNQDNPGRTTVPSAEWPAGSGHDYLFAAGVWVGAIDASGIPRVTTALFDREFSPEVIPTNPCAPVPLDRVADVRESYEGIPGGNRVISASLNPDDDGDGLVDEDFQNGLDDDGDGLCDEDFSAIGQQMFSAEYYDDIPEIRQLNPEHVPLGIRVRQTSYAWGTPGQNDFVGMDYQIMNRSGRSLRNLMIAIMADPDVGTRGMNGYATDDEAGLIDREVEYFGSSGEIVRRRLQMGYAWDNPDDPNRLQDNKGGDAPGYFGCMFLNHTTDPTGVTAPRRVGITSFKYFSGQGTPFPEGDPRNDAQRYQLMTDPMQNPAVLGEIASERPLDYRFLMATGPFRTLLPDSTLTISVGWVVGLGLGGGPTDQGGSLIANAIAAQQAFDGLYTDFDGSLTTGTCGKETCLRTPLGFRFTYTIPESSVCRVRFWSEIPFGPRYSGLVPWNPLIPCDGQQGGRFLCVDQETPELLTHCASEDTLNVQVGQTCTFVDADCDVTTGQAGRELLVHWVAASPLPAPFFAGTDGNSEPRDFLDHYSTTGDSNRVSAWFFPGDRKVTLKWNSFAEMVRDAQRGNLKEFVGYRIYKASGWIRPEGSNSPARNLWSLLGEWRVDPKGTPARPLSELIDPSAAVVATREVTVTWDPVNRRPSNAESHSEQDTLFAVGRYSYVDPNVLNGFPYFYSVAPVSIVPGLMPSGDITLIGNPSATNAQVVYPRGDAQRRTDQVYVVPNPYKGGAQWDLVPRAEDPSGTKVTFHNLPRTRGVIHVFTLAGDLVRDLPFDGTPPADLQYGKDPIVAGEGEVAWNLISRNGQRIVSGIYLYSVDTDLGKQIGRFVIIR